VATGSFFNSPLAHGFFGFLLPFLFVGWYTVSLTADGHLPAGRGSKHTFSQENCMTRLLCLALGLCFVVSWAGADEPKTTPKVAIGQKAPEFKFKDQSGKIIDLAELTAQGPVLVRLTCGCSGCDKELGYFQEIDAAYKKAGLTSVAIFKEGDAKVAKYAQEKKIKMIYGVDTKGEAWNTFQTKTMPTNFLIGKGGEILAIANGCDPSGLIANKLSEKIAKTVNTPTVDVKTKVQDKK
jgi:peroxiredoxin